MKKIQIYEILQLLRVYILKSLYDRSLSIFIIYCQCD